ncbi:uncharacterized protein [Ptychodera flava]|uniref:uncharacterized protein n=1 Tax=Ptychodera flava TaxID=63121 RepID=UPI00396A15F0
MATSLVDIHPTILAIKKPQSVHRVVMVNTRDGPKECYGGIGLDDIETIMQAGMVEYTKPFINSLPEHMQKMDNLMLNSSSAQFRVYQQADQRELATLHTTHLVDEFEQPLHSMEDYLNAYTHVFQKSPPLSSYSENFLIAAPGDWPTFYFIKKLIAHNKLTHNIIPLQGPFHVSLNLHDDHVKLYHFFYSKLYSFVFGGKLASRPKPYRASLVITAAFLVGSLCVT